MITKEEDNKMIDNNKAITTFNNKNGKRIHFFCLKQPQTIVFLPTQRIQKPNKKFKNYLLLFFIDWIKDNNKYEGSMIIPIIYNCHCWINNDDNMSNQW